MLSVAFGRSRRVSKPDARSTMPFCRCRCLSGTASCAALAGSERCRTASQDGEEGDGEEEEEEAEEPSGAAAAAGAAGAAAGGAAGPSANTAAAKAKEEQAASMALLVEVRFPLFPLRERFGALCGRMRQEPRSLRCLQADQVRGLVVMGGRPCSDRIDAKGEN